MDYVANDVNIKCFKASQSRVSFGPLLPQYPTQRLSTLIKNNSVSLFFSSKSSYILGTPMGMSRCCTYILAVFTKDFLHYKVSGKF